MEKPKPNNNKGNVSKPAPAPKKTAAPAPPPTPPLFRKIDWLTFGITFGVIWIIYLLTLAPEQTLEDSGELCTGAFYAGIPHPPGYPFWSIYSWFWTAILPFGNVAWRVEVGESFAAAMGSGMVAFMVSRGSSMLIEGIEDLKGVAGKWENAICAVSGGVAGMLVGLDGSIWSESVVINRISLFAVPWLILVVLMLMRWMYAPNQKRYLYLAMLCYGICATIHQTLLLSAMGVEVLIAAAQPRLGRDLFLTNSAIYLVGLLAMSSQSIPAINNMSSIEVALFHIVGVGSIFAGGWLCIQTKGFFSEWKTIILMGLLWTLGVLFYFYEPLAGMTVPPMQWGYPRTVEGFFHALSRGQYETVHGTNLFQDPMRFVHQLQYIVQGLSKSFNWVFMLIGLMPFLFLLKMHKRERSWIVGLTSIYFCLSVILVILLDVTLDRSSADLNQVFFTASHALFALMIGYGLTLTAAYMATHYAKFRFWGFLGGGIAVIMALFCLKDAAGKLYFGLAGEVGLFELPHWIHEAFTKYQYGLPIYANLILVAMPIVFLVALAVYRNRGPVVILLALFTLMPVYSGMTHWYKSEQRNHWFGYWFGHDMFTPPFTDPKTGKLSYDNDLRAQLLKDPEQAKIIYPEMPRNTILFGGTDPGRFCPTYAIFCDSFIPHSCQPLQDQKFDRRDVYLITQNALADGTYLDYLRSQYFRSAQHDPPFFSEFLRYVLGIPFGQDNSIVNGIAQAAYYVLDVPFTKLGAHIEKRRRAEGVYPPKEIYIPSPDDSQKAFEDYTQDVARRQAIGQLKPGEDVHIDNGRVQVSGQVAVMMINGLLCRVIFDHNPTNEFFVEESFPLDWMYPYETPFGIIMHINREPLTSLTDDIYQRDHAFWTKYSERLCGNFITYDTSVKEICDFAEKIYVQNNYEGFKGDPRFIRDDDGQKAFSKLRSSQAGVYAWRLSRDCPPEYAPKNAAEYQALARETDFAFKQSFAFCPYSPEAVYRYINFLLLPTVNRLDDALLVVKTCEKLDPFNGQITDLVKQLEGFKGQNAERSQIMADLQRMETEAQKNPSNFQNILQLSSLYNQMQQPARATNLFTQSIQIGPQALADPKISYANVAALAQITAQMGDIPKLEPVLQKLIALAPDQPEPRYDFAALEAILGKTPVSIQNLQTALDLSAKRLLTTPTARNLLDEARKDPRFNMIRGQPDFQKLVPPN
jgi:tetratricopeptide (TPR) repeat protein